MYMFVFSELSGLKCLLSVLATGLDFQYRKHLVGSDLRVHVDSIIFLVVLLLYMRITNLFSNTELLMILVYGS